MSKIIRMLTGRPASILSEDGQQPGLRVVPPAGETRRTGQVSTMQYNRSKPMYDGSPTPFRLRAQSEDTNLIRRPMDDEQEMMMAPPVVEGVPDLSGSQQERQRWEAERRSRQTT